MLQELDSCSRRTLDGVSSILHLGFSKGDNYRKTVGEVADVSKDYFVKPLKEKLKDTIDGEMEVFNICVRIAALYKNRASLTFPLQRAN